MTVFTMKDCCAKNAKWYGGLTFLSGAGAAVTYAQFDAQLEMVARELQKVGAGPVRILAIGLEDAQCLFLYGLAERNGYAISVVNQLPDDLGLRAVVDGFPADLIMVPTEHAERTTELLAGMPGGYHILNSCIPQALLGEVTLYRAENGSVLGCLSEGMLFTFLEIVGDNVRFTAVSRRAHMDAVRALCAELPLNCHDVCAMDLPSQTLFGNLAWSCVFYRGAHGIIRGAHRAASSVDAGANTTFTSSSYERSPGLQKVFQLLADPVDSSLPRDTGDSPDRVITALGGAVPSFRLHATTSSGGDGLGPTWTVSPLLGVDPSISTCPAEPKPQSVEAGYLMVHIPFDACVGTFPGGDVGSGCGRSGVGYHGAFSGKYVATGYMARLGSPGRLLVWSPPEPKCAEERGAER